MLSYRGKDIRPLQLSKRKPILEEALAHVGDRVREVTALPGGGADLLKAAGQLGLEGIVSKRLTSIYDGGEVRNGCWIKSKVRPSQEVVVGGFEMDGSRFKGLLAGVYEDGAFKYVGSLGTGFSQSVVTGLLPRLRAVESTVSFYTAGSPPRKTSGIHWTRPELVAAAEIAEWTSSGKLRQASYRGLREDKAARDVVRERS